MINKELFTDIAKHYGHYASWAVWVNEGQNPKSNIGELSIFNIETNPLLLDTIKTNIIMVGLNISRPIEFTFGNFHDKRSQSQDFKIRYAFKDTIAWGAYMTDIIKGFEHLISGTVASYLKKNQEFELKNIDLFKRELKHIQAVNPILIAIGNDSFNILDRYFNKEFQIIKVPHYSMHISKENYRKRIEELLKNIKL